MINTIPASEYCNRIFDGTHETPKPSEHGRPLVTSKNIVGGTLDKATAYNISEEDYEGIQRRSYVSQWDILFSMIGSVGEVYIEKSPVVDYAVKNVGVFSCLNESRAMWLYYYLKSATAQKIIRNHLNGAVQKFLSLGALRSFPVPSFDSNNEPAIQLLSALDAKIALNHRINVELEGMAKLLYDYWFVQYDFPLSAAQAAALGKPRLAGQPYRTSGGKMVFHPTLKREIPEGWKVEPIESILAKEGPSKKIPASEILKSGPIPVIDQSKDFICGFTHDEDALIHGSPKIIFGDHTRILKFINFDFARGADGTQIIVSNSESLPPHLFYHSLLKIDLSSYGYARHFKFLKQSNITLPNSNIAQKFEEIVAVHYELIRANTFQNQELTALRDWLLPMLMNGQVRVG